MSVDNNKQAVAPEILVVDDTPANLQLLTSILSERGYRVRPASGGLLALRSVAAKAPDLILLDIKMPDIDGFEVCRRLKGDERSRDIPVLFISALAEGVDKIKGFALGGLDYITKPFTEEEVLSRIRVHLRLREMTHSLEQTISELNKTNAHLADEILQRKKAEDSLRITQFAVDHASDCLFWARPDGSFANVNDSTCRVLGYSREELLGLSVFDIDPDFPREAWDAHWREIKARQSLTIETRHRSKSGELFPVEVTLNYVEYEGAEYNFAFARNISERKQAEEILRKYNEDLEETVKERTDDLISVNARLATELAERRRLEETLEEYRKVVECSRDMVAVIDLNYRYVLANEAFLRYRNASLEQVIGRTAAEVLGRDIFENTLKKNLDDCFQGKVVEYEMNRSYPTFGERDLLVSYFPVEEAGQVTRVACVIRDITERKLIENELKKNKEFIDIALNSQADTFFILDIGTGKPIRWNKAFRDVSGYSDEEIAGIKAPEGYYGKDDLRKAEAAMQATLSEGAATVEMSLITKSGRLIPTEYTSAVMKDGHGNPCYLIAIGRDISERRRIEAALRDSETRFRALADSSPLAIYASVGLEQKATYVNPTYVQLFGYAPEEIPDAAHWWPLAYPDENYRRQVSEEWQQKVARAHATQAEIEPMEVVVTCKDGSHKDILWGYKSLGGENWTFGLDLTQRKRAEERLVNAKEEWERTFDAIQDPLMILDNHHRIIRANRAMAAKLGVSPAAAAGMCCHEHVHGSGTPPEFCPHAKLLADGQAHAVEIYEERLGGYYHVSVAPLYDQTGKLYGSVHIARDITERKKAEAALRDSEERFQAFMDFAPFYAYVKDASLKHLFANKKTLALISGPKPATIRSDAFFAEERARQLEEADRRILAGLSASEELEYLSPMAGKETWLKEIKFPILLSDGTRLVGGVAVDITERKKAEDKLAREAAVNVAISELTHAILAAESIEEMAFATLKKAQVVTESKFGYVGYIDQCTGFLVCPTMTHEIWDKCGVPGKSIVFEKFVGLWGWVLAHKKSLLTNDPSTDERSTGTPPGHIPVERFLSAPAFYGDTLVGQIALANAPRHYRDDDLHTVEHFAAIFALGMQRKQAEEELRRLNENLEQHVVQRTAEIEKKTAELERMNKMFVGRELRMIELKEKIKELEKKLTESAGRQ